MIYKAYVMFTRPWLTCSLPSPTLLLLHSALATLALLHDPSKLIPNLRAFTLNILFLWNILPFVLHITLLLQLCTQRSAAQRPPPCLKYRISVLLSCFTI